VEVLLPNQWNNDTFEYSASPRTCLERGVSTDDMNRAHVGVRYVLGGKAYCMDSTRIRVGATQFGRRNCVSSQRVNKQLLRNGAALVSVSYPIGQGLTVKEFKPCTRRAEQWNPSYDRKQTKKLAALVQAYLVHGVQ